MKKTATVFSNIGVGEAYLSDAGFHVAAACELHADRCKVYRHIYKKHGPEVIQGDVTLEDTKAKFIEAAKDCHLLIATPPCQGFSTLNPPRRTEGRAEGENDPRNNLIYAFFDLMNRLKPPYALVENVPQMIKAFENKDVQLAVAKWLPDYDVRRAVLDAVDFDTPQSRKRAILLLTRNGMKPWLFPRVEKKPPITLEQAIGKLPPLDNGEYSEVHPWHFAHKHSDHHVVWMSHTPTGQSAYKNQEHYPNIIEDGTKRLIKGFGNTYKRMEWNKPAPTLIRGAHMISSSNTVHPGRKIEGTGKRCGGWVDLYDNPRTLSVLEAMIVMGLPVELDLNPSGRVVTAKVNWDFPNPKGHPKVSCSKADGEICLSYKQAIEYLGEGLCPRMMKALVQSIPV